MKRLAVLVLIFAGLMLTGAFAQPGRRVALVIGNGTYQNAGTLANPVNDAADMAAKLRKVGFEVVEGHDLGKRDLERKIGEFSDALQGADTGLFFYAGHGLQIDGRNFIVPVDAQLDVPVKLRLEAVPIDEVLDIMEQQAKSSLVFLDACRNNPFARSLSAKATTRSATALPGLAQFDTTRGSFIAFSTAPGAVAMDGTGRNSPFAAALLRHIDEPGQSISDMMIAVRRDVLAATHEFQRPYEQGSLLERFEFVPADGAVAAAPRPAASPPQQNPQVASLERSVGDDGSIERLISEGYLSPRPGKVADTARQVYADKVTLLGAPMDIEAIVKAKTDWFAQFKSWSLTLDAGSLKITPRGENRADAVFSMGYDYEPVGGGAHIAGTSRVSLGLMMTDGQWRIVSETLATE